jgi:hypothetical protein
MPKDHMRRALEVLYLFASQKALINVSLTSIGILWHVTDTLGRSRPSAIEAAAQAAAAAAADGGGAVEDEAAAASGPPSARGLRGLGISGSFSAAGAPALAVPGLAGGPGGGGGGPGGGGGEDGGAADHSCRRDLGEEEVTELLLRVFTHLRQLSTDARPEVWGAAGARCVWVLRAFWNGPRGRNRPATRAAAARIHHFLPLPPSLPEQARNSGVRTLFLSINGQAARLDAPAWRYCLWEIVFPLVTYVHVMGDTSSKEEAAAVELGKEKGKAVMMLVHHSRNTEQKQWCGGGNGACGRRGKRGGVGCGGAGCFIRTHITTLLKPRPQARPTQCSRNPLPNPPGTRPRCSR